jgi:hypothetical protein
VTAPLVIAMIVMWIAAMYVVHRIAHVVVTEYGLPGCLIACGAIYAITLIVERRS